MSEQVKQVEQYDEVCPRCGASMGLTHAPWCQFRDGTPMPSALVEMMKAKHEAQQAVERMAEAAPDHVVFMWAVGGLLEELGRVLEAIPFGSTREFLERYSGPDDWDDGEDAAKASLAPFLKALWAHAGHDATKMAELLPANPLLSEYFTMESPEVQAIMVEKA